MAGIIRTMTDMSLAARDPKAYMSMRKTEMIMGGVMAAGIIGLFVVLVLLGKEKQKTGELVTENKNLKKRLEQNQ